MSNTVLFFGSFNPIHCGHLLLADNTLERTGADALWFVVSPQNPFKQQAELADEQHRLRMVELALQESRHRDRLSTCSIEFDLPRPSRTIDTLHRLTECYPDHRFSLLIGSDNVDDFDRWKNYTEILDHYPVLVYPRAGYTPTKQELIKHMTPITGVPLLPQAATEIRHLIHDHQSAQAQLPASVLNYMLENNLYGIR